MISNTLQNRFHGCSVYVSEDVEIDDGQTDVAPNNSVQ